jgi:hypothetical protein
MAGKGGQEGDWFTSNRAGFRSLRASILLFFELSQQGPSGSRLNITACVVHGASAGAGER